MGIVVMKGVVVSEVVKYNLYMYMYVYIYIYVFIPCSKEATFFYAVMESWKGVC